ncbi:hypothetical protein [Nocardia arizonensis]|nr:hypothetical protein [Nocardia arizonensis]
MDRGDGHEQNLDTSQVRRSARMRDRDGDAGAAVGSVGHGETVTGLGVSE